MVTLPPDHLVPADLAALQQLPPALLLKLENIMQRQRPDPPPHYSARTSSESEVATMYKVPHHVKCVSGADSQTTYMAAPFSPPHRVVKVRTPTSCDNSGVQYKREDLLSSHEEHKQHSERTHLVESVASLVQHNTVDMPARHELERPHPYEQFYSAFNELCSPTARDTRNEPDIPRRPHFQPDAYTQQQQQQHSRRLSNEASAFQLQPSMPKKQHNHQHKKVGTASLTSQERAISLIKKLQAKNYASFTFREVFLRHLRSHFMAFAQQAFRMKRVPPGHSRREQASSIGSSNPLFLNSGSLDIRDILVNHIAQPGSSYNPGSRMETQDLYRRGYNDITPPPPVYGVKAQTHGFSQSESEHRITGPYRHTSFTPAAPSERARGHSQPELYGRNMDPALQHMQTPMKKGDKILRLSDFLSLARCQRCNHTQLTLLTSSTNEQLSPTFAEKVRILIPAAYAFSSDQSTITPDITTATGTAIKQADKSQQGGRAGSPRMLSGRRTNPYDAAQDSLDDKDIRNFFMDGHYLSSEKRGSYGSSQTPLDTGEMNMFTQLGDDLVDSFYKLSDTLGNSQGLLQQGSQGLPPPAALESLVPCSTGRSHHRRNESSSILSSIGEPNSSRKQPLSGSHKHGQSFNSNGSNNNRRYETDRQSYTQLPDISQSNGSNPPKLQPDQSLVVFDGAGEEGGVLIPGGDLPRPPSVNGAYNTLNSSLQQIPPMPREQPHPGAISSLNPFDSPDPTMHEAGLRMSFSKELTAEFEGGCIREDTTRRSQSTGFREEDVKAKEEVIQTGRANGQDNLQTARFKENHLREQESTAKACLSTVKKDLSVNLESSVKVAPSDLFPEEISEIRPMADTPFLMDLEEFDEEVKRSPRKSPSGFMLESRLEAHQVARPGAPIPDSEPKPASPSQVKLAVSPYIESSSKQQKCLQMPCALHLQKVKINPVAEEVGLSTRRSSLEMNRNGEVLPLKSGRMKPHQPKEPKPISALNSSRENSVGSNKGSGHFFNRSAIHDRPRSTNPLKPGEPLKKQTSISPKPFKIPKSAVQPQTQRGTLKIAGFTRALKKLGSKGPTPPGQGSARSFNSAGAGRCSSQNDSVPDEEKLGKRVAVQEEELGSSLEQSSGTNTSSKLKLAGTINSLLGNTSSSNLSGTKRSEPMSTLGFSGTIKKKPSIGSPSPFANETASAHAIDLLFQKKSNSTAGAVDGDLSKLTDKVHSLKAEGLRRTGGIDKNMSLDGKTVIQNNMHKGMPRGGIFRIKRAS